MLIDVLVGIIVVAYLLWAVLGTATPSKERAAVAGPVLLIITLWAWWRYSVAP